MLHLIPAPLHRLVLRHGYRVRRWWWRLRRPRLNGVAVIARNPAGEVLLVRLSYGSGRWSLPAGGHSAGEDPADAARREFTEELGCAPAQLRLLAVLEEPLHGATDRVHLFAAMLEGAVRPDGREVLEARWFAPGALPQGLERRVAARLALLEDQAASQPSDADSR